MLIYNLECILSKILPTVFISFSPPATKLGQGNIFRSVCQEFCPCGGCAWQGACMAGGHAWQGGHVWQGDMCGGDMCGRGCAWLGACMVGVCMATGHVWWGACMAGGACVGDMHGRVGMCGRYCEMRSMSGRYTSYWNAFLYIHCIVMLFHQENLCIFAWNSY